GLCRTALCPWLSACKRSVNTGLGSGASASFALDASGPRERSLALRRGRRAPRVCPSRLAGLEHLAALLDRPPRDRRGERGARAPAAGPLAGGGRLPRPAHGVRGLAGADEIGSGACWEHVQVVDASV